MPTQSLQTILTRLGGEKRMDFTLERFRLALKELGSPQWCSPTLVIGGTNGKGSTSLLVSAALVESGFRVATYLSPHLQAPNERTLLNLSPAPPEVLSEIALRHERLAHKYNLTYFEFLTLLHFLLAKQNHVDLQVLEVGLGGRLDATNVTTPLACAITNIALDHQQYLGETKEAILEEKLGIVPREGLLFTGITEPKLLERVEARCAALDAIYYYTKELRTVARETTWEGQRFEINGYPFSVTSPMSAMRSNAALAFLLLRIVFPKIPVAQIQKSFQKVVNPGRFEIVSRNPTIILSGDHNPHGIESLKETLRALSPKNLKILCGFSPDKPYPQMYEQLKDISADILLTRTAAFKAEPPADYLRLGPFESDPHRALVSILQTLSPQDTLLITGSLYLVGELRSRWRPTVEFVRAQ